MKRNILRAVILLSLIVHINSNAVTLILSGIDTIHTTNEYGFDFITQQACTTFSFTPPYDCSNHFTFYYYSFTKQFALNSAGGYGYQAGKINLDSIKTAPPDSIFDKLSLHIDSLPQDSLRSFIGNCYIIKTGSDPRPAWSGVYYAKIKILNFKVIDSAQHQVDMIFLWVFQRSGSRSIPSSGLDTFHLSTSILSQRNSGISRHTTQNGFKIIGDRFIVPPYLLGSRTSLGVYDLRGKMLGKIIVGDKRVIDLSWFVKGRGVLVLSF